jgi:hypothetical protein
MAIRRSLIAAAAAVALSYSSAVAAQIGAVVYKAPWCGCCNEYSAYLNAHGFAAKVRVIEDMDAVKRTLGVPDAMTSCHTAIIAGYAIEGHVPLAAVERLLAEQPDIIGIALPGMPEGAPGMDGVKAGPFEIYAITKAGPKPFMVL